ncbi:hypothetical protein LVY72_14120 [Arthrobacter sp. I2-34]|uniref:Uncharacterized protein n=1 Tax=Arthrobacter hankyongi TaxID=2904801 RepID=A0ABS9L8P2_9MICC|nr:hypothetical protein [Arthrobacter hankyongi]MCG2623035.1 hypothetical protein [Arthrobacter hankyongi]
MTSHSWIQSCGGPAVDDEIEVDVIGLHHALEEEPMPLPSCGDHMLLNEGQHIGRGHAAIIPRNTADFGNAP